MSTRRIRPALVRLLATAVAVAAGVVALLSLPGSPAVERVSACSYVCPDQGCPVEMRINARMNGNSIETALVVQRGHEESCATIWADRWLPPRRYVPAPSAADSWLIGRWLNSTVRATPNNGSEMRISVRIRGGVAEFALQQRIFGEWQARRPVAPFLPLDAADGEWHESEILEFFPAYKPGYPDQPPFTLDRDRQYTATLALEDGSEIEIELFADDAPLTVNWFVFLVRRGYYDGLRFNGAASGDFIFAGGAHQYRQQILPLEFSGRPNIAGAVGMLPTVNPDDMGGRFYVKLSDAGPPPPDPSHIEPLFFNNPRFVFGQIVRGLDTVRAFSAVERAEHELGPLIRKVRITSRPRGIPQTEPGVIPYGLRAGTPFERNLLGDPDAPVLVQRFSPSRWCSDCFYSLLPIDLQIHENLIATGIARYEVIPVREPGSDYADHALSCAADQGKFWELADQTAQRSNNLPFYSSDSFTLDDYAAALGMDIIEFRACIDERRNSAEVERWQRQAEAAGVTDRDDPPGIVTTNASWFVNGVLIEQPANWELHDEAILDAAFAEAVLASADAARPEAAAAE